MNADAEQLALERRRGRIAGIAAFASVAAMVAAVGFASAASRDGTARLGTENGDVDEARRLIDFRAGADEQVLAAAFRCLGLALTVAAGAYLVWLVRARKPELGRLVVWGTLLGPLLIAVSTVLGYFALDQVADQFLASGPRTDGRAQDLVDDSAGLRSAAVFDIVSRIVFGCWLAFLSLEAMRVGLLTRFLAYWGVGSAGALVLLPVGDAMFIGWLASIGFLAAGWWPGGRPQAWTSTRPAPVP